MNRDIETRDKIIWGEYDPKRYCGGIRDFNITVYQLKRLIDQDFIDPDETQNESPTTSDFYDFMNKYPDYNAHGYGVCLERNDYRITLEGLYKNKEAETREELKNFMKLNRYADELEFDGCMRSWFN